MSISPEWQVLLACARTHPTREDWQRIAQEVARPGLDWDRITERACFHGVAPLLYHNLQKMGVAHVVPDEAMRVLARVACATGAQNALLYQSLRQVLGALQKQGIRVIALKGAALAEIVYPNRALRPMSDVDLLLREEALSKAEDTLVEMGYTFEGHPRTRAWFTAHHYHFHFRKPAATSLDVPFELHWHIERPSRAFQIDVEGLWERALPAVLAGVDTLILAPEDLLLHLCLHTCRHATGMIGSALNFRLRSFCDMAEAIRHDGHRIDWGALVRRALQWRVSPYVYLPLQLARDLLDAAVPGPVLAELKPDGFDTRLLGWARAELLQDPETCPLFSDLLTLWRGRQLNERAAVVARILSPTIIAESYGLSPTSKKVYLYYPVRLKDLLVRYGTAAWRLFCSDHHLQVVADGKVRLAEWLALGSG